MNKQQWNDFFKSEFPNRKCWELKGYKAALDYIQKNKLSFEGVNVLDVGSAFGDGITFLSKQKEFKNCKFTALDWSEEAQKYTDAHIKMNVALEEFEASNYDVTICSRLLDYVDFEEWGDYIKKIKEYAPITLFVVSTEKVKDKRKFRGMDSVESNKYSVFVYEKKAPKA